MSRNKNNFAVSRSYEWNYSRHWWAWNLLWNKNIIQNAPTTLSVFLKKDAKQRIFLMKLFLLQLIALSTQLAPQEYLDRWAKNLFIEYTVVNNLVRTTEFDFPAGNDESAFEFKISITNTGEEDLSMNPHWAIYFYHRFWFSSLISLNYLFFFVNFQFCQNSSTLSI